MNNDPRFTAAALGETSPQDQESFRQDCTRNPEAAHAAREIHTLANEIRKALEDPQGDAFSLGQQRLSLLQALGDGDRVRRRNPHSPLVTASWIGLGAAATIVAGFFIRVEPIHPGSAERSEPVLMAIGTRLFEEAVFPPPPELPATVHEVAPIMPKPFAVATAPAGIARQSAHSTVRSAIPFLNLWSPAVALPPEFLYSESLTDRRDPFPKLPMADAPEPLLLGTMPFPSRARTLPINHTIREHIRKVNNSQWIDPERSPYISAELSEKLISQNREVKLPLGRLSKFAMQNTDSEQIVNIITRPNPPNQSQILFFQDLPQWLEMPGGLWIEPNPSRISAYRVGHWIDPVSGAKVHGIEFQSRAEQTIAPMVRQMRYSRLEQFPLPRSQSDELFFLKRIHEESGHPGE